MELVKAQDYNLEESKGNELTSGLTVVRAERELLIEEFKIVSKLDLTEENQPTFKELRLKIVKNRTQGVNKWHKANKDFFLTGGRFVDAIKNMENAINEGMEERLIAAEKHFENIEKERIAKLQEERQIELSKYQDETALPHNGLGTMEQDVWSNYLTGTKVNFEYRIAAEKLAEEQRIAQEKADAKEQERIRLENEVLKAEAIERDRIEKIESDKRAKIESDRLAKEAKEKAVRDERERKEREESEAKSKIEREAKEAAERELREVKEAAAALKLADEKLAQAELNKGDSGKVKDLVADLTSLKSKYTFKSAVNNKMYNDVCGLLDKVIGHIEK